MRILSIHNTYQQAGGEDVVAAAEMALLRNHGHKVHFHSVSNDSIQKLWSKIITAWNTPYSRGRRKETLRIIKRIAPDVVHVHNFFPLLSPSIFDACRDAGVPVVQTLHNYRTICAAAVLMRDGKLCEDCLKGTPYQAVIHGCYRNSRMGSLAVARMIDVHRRRGTWTTKVDRFIALTNSSRDKFVEAGFPAEKIVVKPNFVGKIKGETANGRERRGALFVGRLSQEKGIATLLRAWRDLDVPLKIIGAGPLMDRVEREAGESVFSLGKREPKQVAEEMARASFLIMPSECYETFGLTIIEAFSQGLPVIASRLGAMSEIIEDGVTGLHFTPGDAEDIVRKVRWANDHPEDMHRMGRKARKVYEEKYTPETNYIQLMAIYEEAFEENRKKGYPFGS
jgi:glycosyltransferase involved in cell wall biosynthesis